MGRTYQTPRTHAVPPLSCLPTHACVCCGRPGWCLITREVPCFYCADGLFVHRSLLLFCWCPACHAEDPFCDCCKGGGVIGFPAE